jgi:hypothetical protein
MSSHRFYICIISLLFLFIVATTSFAQNNQNHEDELRAEAIKRNKNYAPWNPNDIVKLREDTGLIGPGPRTSLPEATFPGYLTRPTTVAELMPQALAAVTQKGGRSPLGLADPGDIVLIVIQMRY